MVMIYDQINEANSRVMAAAESKEKQVDSILSTASETARACKQGQIKLAATSNPRCVIKCISQYSSVKHVNTHGIP